MNFFDDRTSNRSTFLIYAVSVLGTTCAVAAKVLTGLGLPALAANAVLVAVVVAFLLLFPIVSRLVDGVRWSAALVLGLLSVAVTVVAAPRVAAMHAVGRGTDQGDCIAVAADRLVQGLWPYSAEAMWTHNPMSCGPLWAALHAPFVVMMNYPMAMLALMAIAMGCVVIAAGRRDAASFAALLVLIPGYWLALANGNDFATFGMVLAAMIALSTSDLAARPFVQWIIVVGVVGLSQARLPFLILPAIIFMDAKKWPRSLGPVAQMVTFAVWSAFLLINPSSFVTEGPMHVLAKAQVLVSPWLFIAAQAAFALGLFVIGRFVAIPNVFVRTELYVCFVLIGMSLLDLVEKTYRLPSLAEALTRWEGASWLTGVACLSAFGVAMRRRRTLGPIDERVSASLVQPPHRHSTWDFGRLWRRSLQGPAS